MPAPYLSISYTQLSMEQAGPFSFSKSTSQPSDLCQKWKLPHIAFFSGPVSRRMVSYASVWLAVCGNSSGLPCWVCHQHGISLHLELTLA